jgi:nucleotide-binding universal stress UspA family protein
MFRRILVGFDDSAGAWSALHHAIDLSRESEALLWMLSVEEPLPRYASASQDALGHQTSGFFDPLQARARAASAEAGMTIECETARGHASQAIVEYAKEIGADLIVVGQHGHAGVLDRMLGSTSDRVVDTAACSVLVVPVGVHI